MFERDDELVVVFTPSLEVSKTIKINCKLDFGVPLEGEATCLIPLDGDLQRRFQFSIDTVETKLTCAKIFKAIGCLDREKLLGFVSRTIIYFMVSLLQSYYQSNNPFL